MNYMKPMKSDKAYLVDLRKKDYLAKELAFTLDFEKVGQNSIYELPTLRAGNFYNSLLSDTKVRINTFKNEHSAAESWMSLKDSKDVFLSMFKPFFFLNDDSSSRVYEIKFANSVAEGYNRLFRNLSYEARVGNVAHELAHTVQLLDLDNKGVRDFVLRYQDPQERYLIEKEADEIAILAGAGDFILAWRNETWPAIKEIKRDSIYQSPKQIEELIIDSEESKLEIYGEPFLKQA